MKPEVLPSPEAKPGPRGVAGGSEAPRMAGRGRIQVSQRVVLTLTSLYIIAVALQIQLISTGTTYQNTLPRYFIYFSQLVMPGCLILDDIFVHIHVEGFMQKIRTLVKALVRNIFQA